MVNAEVAQDVKSTSDWDSLTKGPEVSEEPTKDAEYYRNNPKEIPNLASRLLELRGGLDAPVGTWDENLKTNVDEAGLPTTCVALIKYIKANPDAIDRVVTECERLEGGAGENDAGPIENGAAETEAVGNDSVEGAMDVAESAETEGGLISVMLENSPGSHAFARIVIGAERFEATAAAFVRDIVVTKSLITAA